MAAINGLMRWVSFFITHGVINMSGDPVPRMAPVVRTYDELAASPPDQWVAIEGGSPLSDQIREASTHGWPFIDREYSGEDWDERIRAEWPTFHRGN